MQHWMLSTVKMIRLAGHEAVDTCFFAAWLGWVSGRVKQKESSHHHEEGVRPNASLVHLLDKATSAFRNKFHPVV